MDSNDKPKLLWISDFMSVNSGYGIQTNGILNGLKQSGRFRLYHMALQYTAQPIVLNEITIIPTSPYDPWANDVMAKRIEMVKPDYVVTLMDLFRPCKWLKDQKTYLKQFGAKTIAYFPLDGEPLPYESITPTNVWEQFDYLVPMSYYGKEVLLNELPKLEPKVWQPIWHGIETTIFKPIPDSENSLVKGGVLKGKKFIVSSVFRNILRKNPQALIYAWYRFCRNKEDVLLLLHTNPNEPYPQGTNVGLLINKLGLTNKILFTGGEEFTFTVPPQIVNEVYNSSCVHVSCSTGEGFGLPIIESMATGLPNVLVDYTTSRELLGIPLNPLDEIKIAERGILLPYHFDPPVCSQLTQRAMIDYKKVSEVLENFYKRGAENLKKSYQLTCRDFAVQQFDWKTIMQKWNNFFSYVMDNDKRSQSK